MDLKSPNLKHFNNLPNILGLSVSGSFFYITGKFISATEFFLLSTGIHFQINLA